MPDTMPICCGVEPTKSYNRPTNSYTLLCETCKRIGKGPSPKKAVIAFLKRKPGKAKAKAKRVDYYEYLSSPEWKERAADMVSRIAKCQIGHASKKKGSPCSGPLQVHHNTYDRLGREFDTDLLVVCKYHHEIIHEINSRLDGLPREGIHLLKNNELQPLDKYSIILVKSD